MRSIDSLLAQGRIERVNFIKMDVEGHEPPILRGAEPAIRRFRPKLAKLRLATVGGVTATPGRIGQPSSRATSVTAVIPTASCYRERKHRRGRHLEHGWHRWDHHRA
jgi:hypothetical protein